MVKHKHGHGARGRDRGARRHRVVSVETERARRQLDGFVARKVVLPFGQLQRRWRLRGFAAQVRGVGFEDALGVQEPFQHLFAEVVRH